MKCDRVEYIAGGNAEGIGKDELLEKMVNLLKKDGRGFKDAEWELKKGVEIEMEHTRDPKVAEEIARDHLMEFPDYYTYLVEMEKILKNKWV